MDTSNQQESGYLSDESSFYGSPRQKLIMEARSKTFDPSKWWRTTGTKPSLNSFATLGRSVLQAQVKVSLCEPYKRIMQYRQLDETVDEFLLRLPPATTKISPEISWIRIANPFTEEYADEEDLAEEPVKAGDGEGEPKHREWAYFMVLAMNILDELTSARNVIVKEMTGQPALKVSKAVNKARDEAVENIQKLAKELNCTTGKWMLFCTSFSVNEIWSTIARATATNALGIQAKVAPSNPEHDCDNARLICIYTKDFTDLEDVVCVLRRLKDLGLVDGTMGRAIYYKCDVYTHLGLNSNNEYDIKASLYNSSKLLKPEKTLDKFIQKAAKKLAEQEMRGK